MSVARKLERRLERLLDTAGRIFSGRPHLSEIADRLTREADFARFDHPTGPATANKYTITLNPADLVGDLNEMTNALVNEIEKHASEEGLRLEGPVSVEVVTADSVQAGSVVCHAEVVPGAQVPWARLIGEGESFLIGRNRAIVGRSAAADTPLPHEDISREHALIWRTAGQSWIKDLGSANGTKVEGRPVRADPARLEPGARVTLASHEYRFKDR